MQSCGASKNDFSACAERMINGDKLAKLLGIAILECRTGYSKAIMPHDKRLLNAAGILHGGAIFSLADIALAFAANSSEETALTISASISFFKAGQDGPFMAEAREISASSKLGHYEVTVYDVHNDLIAKLSGTAYKKR